jgi:hypothetical protein
LSTSLALSADVGSSITIRRDCIESARAISTICCSATERSRTSAIGFMSRPMRLVITRVSATIFRQLTKGRMPGSRPMKTFSAIVMLGASVNSW